MSDTVLQQDNDKKLLISTLNTIAEPKDRRAYLMNCLENHGKIKEEELEELEVKLEELEVKEEEKLINEILKNCKSFIHDLKKNHKTVTKPGSLTYLLWGETPSNQSLSIKMGKYGEHLFKEIIRSLPHLTLLKCGVQTIGDKSKKKDIDLIWLNKQTNTVYVRECKGNIELDTEKLPATFEKMTNDIKPWALTTHPKSKVDIGIINWSIYDRDNLKAGLSHIRKCEASGVKVQHVKQFVELVGIVWGKQNYENHFRKIGEYLLAKKKKQTVVSEDEDDEEEEK